MLLRATSSFRGPIWVVFQRNPKLEILTPELGNPIKLAHLAVRTEIFQIRIPKLDNVSNMREREREREFDTKIWRRRGVIHLFAVSLCNASLQIFG